MRLDEVVRAVVRRWYFLLIGLVGTAAVCFAAFMAVPPSYEAHATVLLLPPVKQLPAGANPFLYLGGLQQPAEVLTKYLSGPGPQEAFADKHPTATYQVALDTTTTNGPVIAITVDDSTPAGALAGLGTVAAAIPTGLGTLEKSANVTNAASIGSMVLARDNEPDRVTKATIRAVGAAGAAALLATLLIIQILDGLMSRAAERRLLKRQAVGGISEPNPAVHLADRMSSPQKVLTAGYVAEPAASEDRLAPRRQGTIRLRPSATATATATATNGHARSTPGVDSNVDLSSTGGSVYAAGDAQRTPRRA